MAARDQEYVDETGEGGRIRMEKVEDGRTFHRGDGAFGVDQLGHRSEWQRCSAVGTEDAELKFVNLLASFYPTVPLQNSSTQPSLQ